jgi:hypothetical protein
MAANVELVSPNPLLRWSSLSSTVFTDHALHHTRWTNSHPLRVRMLRTCIGLWPMNPFV